MFRYRTIIVLTFLLAFSAISNWQHINAAGKEPKVVARINSIGASPVDLAFTPDGKTLYVSNDAPAKDISGLVFAINTEDFTVKQSLISGIGMSPIKLIIDRAGSNLYVLSSRGIFSSVSIPEDPNKKFNGISNFDEGLSAAAVSRDNALLYVTNQEKSRVQVFKFGDHVVNNSAIATIPKIGLGSVAVVINKSGNRAYVANNISNDIAVIDTASNSLITKIDSVGSAPIALAVSPDDSRLYVVNNLSNDIAIIDTATNKLIGKIADVGKGPIAIAVRPDGKRIYVANNLSNDLAIINTAKAKVIGSVDNVGKAPRAIAVSPDGKRVFVANNGSANIAVISAKE